MLQEQESRQFLQQVAETVHLRLVEAALITVAEAVVEEAVAGPVLA